MSFQELYESSFIYLLGKITPNLRCITINVEEKNALLRLRFYYEGAYSELEKELAHDIADNIYSLVWNEYQDKVDLIVSSEDISKLSKNTHLLYSRYEADS